MTIKTLKTSPQQTLHEEMLLSFWVKENKFRIAEEDMLRNRLSILLSTANFKERIKLYLTDFFFIGHSTVFLTSLEQERIDSLEEYFECYLFNHDNDLYNLILSETHHNPDYFCLLKHKS